MKTEIISPEYMKLQEEITALYEKWVRALSHQTIVKKENIDGKLPILPQADLQFNEMDYQSFLQDLFLVVKENKPEIGEDLAKMEANLDNETLSKWFHEALIVNMYYFSDWAEKNHVPDWLPIFAAEHAVRPYLHKAGLELKDELPKQGHTGSCPCCGEPARLALINKAGKKELLCPRCHSTWEQKKISCAHCGSDTQGDVIVLKLEDDERAEIYACKSCKGYTKVIDTRKLFEVPAPEILDLKTIHCDYIAQENGYGLLDKEKH
ncbi:formate dehydrogenase accessory protein FdhE [Niallia endozanthoxylica]|uniref:Formate dehydrogenase accessory protein FdhE n=1 Tax=Niallia endozanthoxylica TaxID=2036016 RepID=A0A5J5H1Z9_9BACI|nr:formate dehydrogenase accessory protein FdhE [Niallia endozanthoxylica]KAA9014480.1 formate dehydrogenase accessory protein FdhE [Niallia endozanthoxylica]